MRPLGISLIALYQILRSLAGLMFGLFILLYAGPANKLAAIAAQGNFAERFIAGFGHQAGVFVLAFAVVHALAAYGLLRMQRWSRFFTALLCALELPFLLPSAIHANIFSLVFAGLNAASVVYLATRRFRPKSPSSLRAAA